MKKIYLRAFLILLPLLFGSARSDDGNNNAKPIITPFEGNWENIKNETRTYKLAGYGFEEYGELEEDRGARYFKGTFSYNVLNKEFAFLGVSQKAR